MVRVLFADEVLCCSRALRSARRSSKLLGASPFMVVAVLQPLLLVTSGRQSRKETEARQGVEDFDIRLDCTIGGRLDKSERNERIMNET